LVLFILILFSCIAASDTVCQAQAPLDESIHLKRVRSVEGKGYTAFIFMFDKEIPPQQPQIQGNEITIRFDGVATELGSRREYRELDSWIALEPGKGYLTARIGIPGNFSRLDNYRNKNRDKWIIRLYPEVQTSDKEKNRPVIKPAPESVASEKKPIKKTRPVKPADPEASATTETASKPETVDKKVATQDVVKSNGLLTLNFFQSDIQEILSALAMEREINFATAQNVSGKVSVHLYQVTLDEALNAIALAGGFEYRLKDDLYYFYKSDTVRAPQAEEHEMKVFRLQYAETGEMESILKALPNMGSIQAHKASQTLLVEDTRNNIKKIETILGHWDRRPKQVLIEAKILEISLTDDMTFGVDWAKVLGEFNLGTQGFSKATLPTTEAVSPLPGGSSIGVFANLITAIGTNYQFSVALDALQTKTKVNTLSTPKVLAVHGKVAKVQVGGQQGYRVTTTNLGVATETIEFIDTGTILEITPYIYDDGRVLLNVLPSIQDATIETGGIPVVTSTNVATWLLAKSGETVFIGGLIKNKDEKAREGLPCLGNLPAVGPLFGRTGTKYKKTELVVMITPLILQDELQHVELKEKEKVYREDKKFSSYPLPPKEQIREFVKPME